MEPKGNAAARHGEFALKSRRSTYFIVTGIAIGTLLTGLVLPFAVGERAPTNAASSGSTSASATGSSLEPFQAADTGTPTDSVPGEPAEAAPTPASDTATAPGGEASAAPGGAAPSSDGAAAAPPPASGSLTASDVGVTPTTIKVGFLLLDVGSIGKVGIGVPGVSPEQQKLGFEAQLAEVNERGGINGRKLVGAYESFDVLSQDDMRRACLALRDQKVFGVVAAGGLTGPATLCVTEEGRTPLITNGSAGTPSEYIRRSNGLFFAMYPTSDRLMANWVAELERLGSLKGKRIGILSTEATNPGDTVIGGDLVGALRRFGYQPAHISRLSADPGTASGQIPIEVQQMRSKNVDLVMIATGTLYATQFVQAADGQRYDPTYTFSDWGSMSTDASNQNMPQSYDGTIAVTTYRTGEEKVGVGESGAERECRAVYERRTGKKLAEKGSNEHGLFMSNCTTLQALMLGMGEAGPNLTRSAFSNGMQSIGPLPMTMWGGGSFAKGKFGAADLVRTIRWHADCRCLKPASDFRPPQF